MNKLNADAKHKFYIIAAKINSNTPTLEDISRVTETPESTLKRQIVQIQTRIYDSH